MRFRKSLNQVTFGTIAGFTRQFNVAGGVAAAFCDGNNVIVFQIFPAAAFLAFAFVSAPDFSANCGWNGVAAFAGHLLFVIVGPLVALMFAPITFARMLASVALPEPGGPVNRMWLSA